MDSRDVQPATDDRPWTTEKEATADAPPVQRGSRVRFSSDDSPLVKQILATHAPDMVDRDVKPILAIIEDIIRPQEKPSANDGVALGAQPQSHADKLADKVSHSSEHDADIVKVLAYPIYKILSEIICKFAAGAESHSATMELLKSLSSYSWDAKAVIVLAAFAINYGEVWLVDHFQTKNARAMGVATLKDLPDSMDELDMFKVVTNVVTAALKVTNCIIQFKELPPIYVGRDSPEVTAATADIPSAVYWIIRSLLACTFTLLNLADSGHEYITSATESWELLSLAHELSVIMEHLQRQLQICYELVDRKEEEDAYNRFKRTIKSSDVDNMTVLRAIIHAREDERPLYGGSKRTNERLDVLRQKYVLLLISDLQLPREELNVLRMIYNQPTFRHECDVLWLPMVDPSAPTSSWEPVFYDLRNYNMPWYSVDHPSMVERVAARYIREDWKFVHMPMLVVLDPQGKPSNLDAFPMMWIWGGNAFPFTQAREKSLWSETTWNIDLLIDAIDPRIPDWILDQRVICLYGGEDIDWIRKFTIKAGEVASHLKVPMEMLYVGKRNPKETVRMYHEVIDREKLSHVFPVADYYDYVWYFWVRLVSMWNSRRHLGMMDENDVIMREIMAVLAFDSDSSNQGWAVLSRGNYEITKGKGDDLMRVLERYSQWASEVDHPDKFVPVLDKQLRGLEHRCQPLVLREHASYIPEAVVCSECGRTLERYVLFFCCND